MKRKAGLWIDHKKAVIVIISDNEPHIKLVISKVEKQPGRFEGKRPKT
jgi:stalled ribosome rescue protein Dom34